VIWRLFELARQGEYSGALLTAIGIGAVLVLGLIAFGLAS
jgi:hypothetical protein